MNDNHRKQQSVKFSGDRKDDVLFRLMVYIVVIIIALAILKAVLG